MFLGAARDRPLMSCRGTPHPVPATAPSNPIDKHQKHDRLARAMFLSLLTQFSIDPGSATRARLLRQRAPLSTHQRLILYARIQALFNSRLPSWQIRRRHGRSRGPGPRCLTARCAHALCDFVQCSSPLPAGPAPRLLAYRSRCAARTARHGGAPPDDLRVRGAQRNSGQAGCAANSGQAGCAAHPRCAIPGAGARRPRAAPIS